MLATILLVLLVMTMFMWLLSLLGAVQNAPAYSPWMAWFACLWIALAVYLVHFGAMTSTMR